MASDAKQQEAMYEAILKMPAMAPPAGQVSNLVNPDSQKGLSIALFSLFMILSSSFVIARMYTKIFIIRKVQQEDYACVMSFLFFLAFWTACVYATINGAGKHQWDIRVHELILMLYWTYIATVLYAFVLFFIKVTISLQYLRIFPAKRKSDLIYWGPYAVIYANALFWIAAVPAHVVGCTPRDKYWNFLRQGHCINYNALDMTTGVFNVISDVVLLLIPQQTIWKLQMPLRQKLSLSAIFMVGLFACVSSAIRVYYSKVALSYDISYNVHIMGWWVFAEMCASFVSSCMPILPKLFQTTWKKLFPHHPQISFRNIQMHLKTEKKKWPQPQLLEDGITERFHPSGDQESGWGHRSDKQNDESTGASNETKVP